MKSQRIVLITGASTGIGKSTAEYLAQNNYIVYAGARKQQDLDNLNTIENVIAVQIDVTKTEEIADVIEKIKATHGKLDVLVNNAGISLYGPLMALEKQELESQFSVNVFGTHEVTQQAFQLLLESDDPRIIFITSVTAKLAYPWLAPYSMSKHAEDAYASSLRRELSPYGFKVSIIEPGTIDTPIWHKADYEDPRFDDTIFKDRFRRMARVFIRNGRKNGLSPQQVVDAIFDAVTSDQPKIRYLITENNRLFRFFRLFNGKTLDKRIKQDEARFLQRELAWKAKQHQHSE